MVPLYFCILGGESNEDFRSEIEKGQGLGGVSGLAESRGVRGKKPAACGGPRGAAAGGEKFFRVFLNTSCM